MDPVLTLLIFAAPVGFAALGETVNQKSGTLNIGLEGMMLIGAYTALTVALDHGTMAGFLAAIAAVMAVGALQALFVLKLAADQVVTGTAINLLAMGVTATLYRQRFGNSGALISTPDLPRLFGVDPVLPLLILLPILGWWVFKKTRWGLALRAAGEYPDAVEAVGFNVLRIRFEAQMIAAALAALGGAYLALGVSHSFAENMTAGRGFVALALVTFGRWKPIWVLGAALLVGVTEQLQFEMQARGSHLPSELLTALPYLAALLVLILAGRGAAAPGALGRPFRRLK
jgi:simple sugar transport system permease protein